MKAWGPDDMARRLVVVTMEIAEPLSRRVIHRVSSPWSASQRLGEAQRAAWVGRRMRRIHLWHLSLIELPHFFESLFACVLYNTNVAHFAACSSTPRATTM